MFYEILSFITFHKSLLHDAVIKRNNTDYISTYIQDLF